MRGIQLQLLTPPGSPIVVPPLEPKGVVYTKRWVVDLLLDLAGYVPGNNLADAVAVEPSAGTGAFLGPMIERLIESCRRLGRPLSDCQDSLIAFELDRASAEYARQLAITALIDHGLSRQVSESLASRWVRNEDYLFASMGLDANFVIGNPPYVRLEEIPEETAAAYRNSYPAMTGRADLYIAFFEAALHQLKENGVCAFICADRWMRNQYGAGLRELIAAEYGVEAVIDMHRADGFKDEVDAYPAITVIRRQRQGRVMVASAGPEVKQASPQAVSEAFRAAVAGERTELLAGLRTAVVHSWFQDANPWPCHSPEQLLLLRELEDRFPTLETHAKVGIGVATGNDSVFITRDPDLVEPSRLLKLALAKDISSGAMQWSGYYLVDPWNDEGLVDLARYPRLGAYFGEHAVALKKRHTAVKNAVGWYKTIDRVSHALTTAPKLYIADIKAALDPVLDVGETYPHHNLYFIQSGQWDLEVLGGLLLSTVGQFFVECYGIRMRGGYWRFQAQYLRRIRVPAPQHLSRIQSNHLKEAFHARDRERATHIALELYGIDSARMETARGFG